MNINAFYQFIVVVSIFGLMRRCSFRHSCMVVLCGLKLEFINKIQHNDDAKRVLCIS